MSAAATLVVELVTEELPPKTLKTLAEAFGVTLAAQLRGRGLLAGDSVVTTYATPRRLAVSIGRVAASVTLPPRAVPLLPVNVAFDASGGPTEALDKAIKAKTAFATYEAVPSERIERRVDGKLERVFYIERPMLVPLRSALDQALRDAIEKLPIPKVMSYASRGVYYNDAKFARPAHRLVALHGADIVPVAALGLDAGRTTAGAMIPCSSSELVTVCDLGTRRPAPSTHRLKSSRSSARSITASGAPISSTSSSRRTPASASSRARFSAV